ncbi:hypothetical protein KZC52_14150 [Microbacterium sp. kSW2-24]|uniref:hypothetical protein n=1 Tax=Microbacterium galbinum TaxID=2851646 RepID=UPI001FFDEBCE|nr:hypothetical protein [Microbacterium galbinum]MCK2024077.1 hypothetical protein [Microbacterium galbinum]
MTDVPDAARPDETDAPSSVEAPKRRRGLWISIAVAAVIVVGAAIAIPVSIANAEAAEKAAAEQAAAKAERDRLAAFGLALGECNTRPSVNVEILDDDETLSLHRVGKYNGPAYDDMLCILRELGAPAALESKIGATRALDGAQTDDWPGYEIEWRYHPDDGATVLIEHAS